MRTTVDGWTNPSPIMKRILGNSTTTTAYFNTVLSYPYISEGNIFESIDDVAIKPTSSRCVVPIDFETVGYDRFAQARERRPSRLRVIAYVPPSSFVGFCHLGVRRGSSERVAEGRECNARQRGITVNTSFPLRQN